MNAIIAGDAAPAAAAQALPSQMLMPSATAPTEVFATSELGSEPLEPIVEGAITFPQHARRVMSPRKCVEKERLQRCREEERIASAISVSTVTANAPGDALKAQDLDLQVGSTRLLENAHLVISEQTRVYGLVGPNGCGKTTLMRIIAREYAPEYQLPMPCNWGLPYLVDQLDPEPTGRSPVEEVLSCCKERTTLLDKHRVITEQLMAYDEQLQHNECLSDEGQRLLEEVTEEMADIDEQLARWDQSEREVTRILVGLGFHDGDKSADGAPSLREPDELVVGIEGLKINGPAEVRDHDDEQWLRGIVTSFGPLMVRPDGYSESFIWAQVRHARELSGGWRKKINLAKALWMKPKLLLLDEPTNHLDFHALLWLEEELNAYPCTVVIVSHNACFLSEVCNKVLQIVDKRIMTIPMADLSLEHLAAMQRAEEKHCKFRDWRFPFPSGDRPEMHGLSFHHVSFSYSPETPQVLQDVHRDVVRFHGRSRSVILGRNGSGKSTMLKLCLGIIEPTHGNVDVSCEIRHFSQHFNEALDRHPECDAASYLVKCCQQGLQKRFHHTDKERLHEDACEVLSWFGLGRRESAKTSIKDLSGGQKARVNFAFLSLCPAHLLILDEPTNHLDANGLEHLADALTRFEGGVVLVSHDELLIQRVLASSEHSELLVCSNSTIHHQSGVQGLAAYRRAAFHEQHLRAEAAARAVEQRLQASRQERRGGPRGRRRCASTSEASTREPTPDTPSVHQPEQVQQPQSSKRTTLDWLFKKKGTRKPKSINFNRQ